MQFEIEFDRDHYVAKVEQISELIKNEYGEFETKWCVELVKENEFICCVFFKTPYDKKPDIIDVTGAISDYFNRFCLNFAKYGKEKV